MQKMIKGMIMRGIASISRWMGLLLGVTIAASTVYAQGKAKDRYIAHLEDPDRVVWQKPDEVVAALGLKGGETVVDLGAGTGYFSVALSKAVGPTGKVYALDVDEELLVYLRKRLEKEKIGNVIARRVPADDPQLAAKSVDVIFLCNVYHHLSHRNDYLKKLKLALKPSGRIVIVDYHKRADVTAGAPLEHRIAQETVIEELRTAGFSLAQTHTFLPSQYFLLFQSTSQYSVSALAADVAAVVKAQPNDEAKMQSVAPVLERFLREGSLEDKFQHPQHGIDVTSYMLFADPDETFFIAALVLRPGARTPVHDHQTWTVWGSYKGKDKETPFSLGAAGADAFPQLQPLAPRVLSDQGIVFTPRPPHDIHIVENVGDTVSVSIHIHGADMRKQERNLYDLRKRVVIPFVQSYEQGS